MLMDSLVQRLEPPHRGAVLCVRRVLVGLAPAPDERRVDGHHRVDKHGERIDGRVGGDGAIKEPHVAHALHERVGGVEHDAPEARASSRDTRLLVAQTAA